MNNRSSIATDFFFVIAKQTTDGKALTVLSDGMQRKPPEFFKTVWYGIDSASGGYPFWSSYITGAEFLTLDKASKAFNALQGTDGESTRMQHGILLNSIKIVEVVCNVREDLDPVEIERKDILAKLSPRERKILRVE